ncbi:MAG: lactate utilization protein [Eubacteriales bacterium]
MYNRLESTRNDKVAQKVIKGLDSRNMQGFYVKTKEEALAKAMELIEEGSSIGWGGSASIEQIGLKKALEAGEYTLIDRDKAKSIEEKEKIVRECFSADYFLTSTNAISEDGILVNIDGNSNRVAAICFGPKKVIMIVGMNKVCKTEADAMSRARNTAAPINAQRFPIKTPCKETGSCANCLSKDTICCQFVTTRFSRHTDRIYVILVDENLGF